MKKEKRFNLVYKITNTQTGKYYIGVHSTNDIHDEYMGSGKLIKRAIAAHGAYSFTKEILFEFTTAELAFLKEKELVTDELVASGATYNLKEGGSGGDTICQRKWFNNGTTEKYYNIEDAPIDWIRGRLAACKFKDRAFQKEMNIRANEPDVKLIKQQSMKQAWKDGRMDHRDSTNLGKCLSEEGRAALRVSGKRIQDDKWAAIPKEDRVCPSELTTTVECQHCHMVVRKCNYTRWHGDKCKKK